jgi:hypothetical protein
MAVLVTATHVFPRLAPDVGGRDSAFGRPGHDGKWTDASTSAHCD